jgi:hypothetical protein
MRRPDQNYEHEQSSSDLMTELLLPVYLAAWTRASARSEELRPSTTIGDEVDSDADHRGDDEVDPDDRAFLIFLARAVSGWLRTCDLERHGADPSCASQRSTTTPVRPDVCGTSLVCSTSHS